jgi:hypothetical protein
MQNQPNLRAKSGKIMPVPKTIIENMVTGLNSIILIAEYLFTIAITINTTVIVKASIAARL